MQVQDYTTANDLKDSTVKRAWLGVVMGIVIDPKSNQNRLPRSLKELPMEGSDQQEIE